jgi:hypothetical protein
MAITIKGQVQQMAMEIDEANAMYIMEDARVESKVDCAERFEKDGDAHMVEFVLGEIRTYIQEYSNKFLTPANVKVGDGVTMHLYSDSHAGTVIKVTKTSVTVRRDKSTLDPNWKPEIEAGGFAGHCTNQNEQTYTYEEDPNGETIRFTWSKKRSRFQNAKMGRSLTKGRREFYDYNF